MTYFCRQNRWQYRFTVLLLVSLTICGCDVHKEERASLRTQITAVETELAPLKEETAGVSKSIDTLTSEIKQISDALQEHAGRRTKLKDALALYVLDHKMTTLVLAMTAASIAALVNDNVDQETKDKLKAFGVIGAMIAAVYCLNNAEECASVTAKLAYFGSEIESEAKAISSTTTLLSQKKSFLRKYEDQRDSLGVRISAKTSERDSLQRKHDSLLCKVCF